MWRATFALGVALICSGVLFAETPLPGDLDRATALATPVAEAEFLTAATCVGEDCGAPDDVNGGFRDGECLSGGCSNFNSNYPSGTFSTTVSTWTTVSSCIYGGEYAFYNVTSGNTYEWTQCTADGGACSFDGQLTLWDQAGTTAYCFSDTYCGDDAKIRWTATFTGVVRVLVSKYNCLNQSTCTTLRWRLDVPQCSITCPTGAITEPEPCITLPTQVTDDGCNMTPNQFVDIYPGDTYCGQAATYMNGTTQSRDTDWYRLELTAWSEITWTVSSEFPSAVFIISGACGDVTVENAAYGGNCTPVSAVKCLPPGIYYLFVSLGTSTGGIFTGYPCGDYNDYWAAVTTVPCSNPTSYCTATATTCDEYVSQVQVADINNSSACTTGGYADYTAIVGNMSPGVGYPITVTNGNPYTSDYCGVWVDWNHDNYFAYSEKVAMAVNPGTGPYTGTITSPPGAPLGTTRMRVRINYNAAAPACGNTTYGETEDYTINLAPPIGACCLETAPYCEEMLQGDCTGVFLGAGTTCDFGTNCNANEWPDACDFAMCDAEPWCDDCNENDVLDVCDIAGASEDCQPDGIPDECQLGEGGGGVVIDESFEGATFPPAGWENIALDLNGPWQISTNLAYVHTGLQGAVHPWSTPNNADSYLLTPELTVTPATLHVWSIGCFGQTWCDYYDIDVMIVVGAPGGGDDIFVGNLNDLWVDSFVTWIEAVYDLTPLLPAGPYRIGFRYYGLDGDLGVIDDVLVETDPLPPSNDCNDNQVPDECDIASGYSLDCCGDGIPDECQGCDLNGDDLYTYADFLEFVDAFGSCASDPEPNKYRCEADMDCDGCVNLKDYGIWLECYLDNLP